MSVMRDEIAIILNDYRASQQTIRNGKREVALLQSFKWQAIKDGIQKIDMEAV